MADELLKLRGRLGLNNQLAATLRAGIEVDIAECRCMLDKYVPAVELQTDRIRIVTDRLCKAVTELLGIEKQIAEIKRDLGE